MSGEIIFSLFYGGIIIFIGWFTGRVIGKQFDRTPIQVEITKGVGN